MAGQRDGPSISIEVLAERIEGMKDAVELANVELQRHLETLNHHREQDVNDRARYLPREVHDQFFNEYRQTLDRLTGVIEKCMKRDQFDQFFSDFGHWRDEVNDRLAKQAGATQNTRLWMAVITLILMAVSVIGRWLLK